MSLGCPETAKSKSLKNFWELGQRIFCVEHYFRSGSFKKVHELFREKYRSDSVPHKTCIQKWVNKFRKYGTLANLPTVVHHLPPTTVTPSDTSILIMSSQKGNAKRSRAQKHQNSNTFKNNLYDKSDKTKFLNSLEVNDVCPRCKDILEWRIKYKKYKLLKAPTTCVKCHAKRVTASYRTVCQPCATSLSVCPKCVKPQSEWHLNSNAPLPPADVLTASGDEDNEIPFSTPGEDGDWNSWLVT